MVLIMERVSSKENDFAIAKLLYLELIPIIKLVRSAGEMDIPEDYQIDELNRAYVHIVHELEKLADKHLDFAQIKPEPIWRKYDVLKSNTWNIHDYYYEWKNSNNELYLARLDKLCIIAGSTEPIIPPELKNMLDSSSVATKNYEEILDDAQLDINHKIEESWYIPEYNLLYEADGTILVNDVMRLKKAQIDSATDKLLEQAFKKPNVLFTPDLGITSRNLSTHLSSAGFSPVLRRIFFPLVSKKFGIFFRPTVSWAQVHKEGVDTTELDNTLRQLGADYTFSK